MSAADQESYDRALQDIEKYRKGEINISLQDTDGAPLPGYLIEYQQVSHEFLFMSFEDPPSKIQYLRPAGFNSMTLNLWWTLVEPNEGNFNLEFVNFYRNIEELSSGGLSLKAQGLLFLTGNPTDTPTYMYQASFEELLHLVERHMTTLVKRFGPYIDKWEPINEPDLVYANPFRLSKDQYLKLIETSANAIRANDPTALIEINFSSPCDPRVRQMLNDILDAGIDFDVVGLQFYYNAFVDPKYNFQPSRLPLADISRCLDDYETLIAPYGKRISGSEVAVPSQAPPSHPGYWGKTWDEDLQAQYLEATYAIFFSKPTNMAINYWSGVDPGWFVWHSGLVDDAGRPKKAYWALHDLIGSWTTQGDDMADDHGEINIDGFGGAYEAVIIDPTTGASMNFNFEIHEQDSKDLVVTFIPNVDLLRMRGDLQRLLDHWIARSKNELVMDGEEYLALFDHHLALGERERAEQTISAAIARLSVTQQTHISGSQLKGYYGHNHPFVIEGSDALLWSAGAAYYELDFPDSVVEVNITASGRLIGDKWPIMVVGIGDKYSQPFAVTDGYQTYSTTFETTGSEKILTIRFLYDHSNNPGEWKLYVRSIDLAISTDLSQIEGKAPQE
jgi:GH35 family endo-1,4-beta-xylanase